MSYFLTALIALIAGGIVTHFYWAALHKAEIDGRDVLLDEARQAEAWAKRQLSDLQAKVKFKK